MIALPMARHNGTIARLLHNGVAIWRTDTKMQHRTRLSMQAE